MSKTLYILILIEEARAFLVRPFVIVFGLIIGYAVAPIGWAVGVVWSSIRRSFLIVMQQEKAGQEFMEKHNKRPADHAR